MKCITFLLLFGGILGFYSCQKIEEPILVDHKFTYHIKTDGKDVFVRYKDYNGDFHETYLSNETWHITYRVKVNDLMYILFRPTEDCHIEFYAAQDGKKISIYPWTLQQANYGKYDEFSIKENP